MVYTVLAWGYQPGRLVTLQKKAVRAITSSAYNAHTSHIFKNLRLLKIYDIHTLQQLKFYYKMVHTNLPIYFNTLPLIRNQDIHGHNTRCRNKIGTIRTKHEFAKRCIRYSLAHTTVVPATAGHRWFRGKVALRGRWPLVTGNGHMRHYVKSNTHIRQHIFHSTCTTL